MESRKAAKPPREKESSVVVRKSKIQGRGVFARARIAEGTRIVEYTGVRISYAEADADSGDDDPARRHHTFFFAVDDDVVIDGSRGGSDARFVNHSCDPNCEIVIEGDRVYVHSLRDIVPGEELLYDYWYITDEAYTMADLRRIYPCRCGAADCRGTLSRPRRRLRRARKAAG
jgi:SET domain-containing protein